MNFLPALNVPQLDRPIQAGGGKVEAIPRKSQGLYSVAVPTEDMQAFHAINGVKGDWHGIGTGWLHL